MSVDSYRYRLQSTGRSKYKPRSTAMLVVRLRSRKCALCLGPMDCGGRLCTECKPSTK